MNWLCHILGCKVDCSDEKGELLKCQRREAELQLELTDAKNIIRQLERMVPRPPPPKLDYMIEKSDAWVNAQLTGMGLHIIRLNLDNTFKITNPKNWFNIVAYDTTDQLPYIRSIFDCEDFTFLFKVMTHLNFGVNQMAAILDYQSGHAYGLVLFDGHEHMIQEIQSDGLYIWTKRIKDFYPLEGAIALM